MVDWLAISGRANGHNKELFFPWTVKSCSRTVEREVRRADNLKLLLTPDILLSPLAVDPVDLPPSTARRCAAFLPSLIATAVWSFELVCDRWGSGTNPARSAVDTCKSGGSCSFAKVLEISGSPDAYLSAKYWYFENSN
jgi:hypothetical protein